jgi:lipopolysaccharide transport system ATP-binding protein
MSDLVITAEHLSKSYLIGHQSAQRERYTALRDVVAREARNFARKTLDFVRGKQIIQGDEVQEFWALRDVSFEVKHGEVLGIIGRNGAGKSTLLKILSRITEPDRGRAILRGRVASLLEVGTGFHPELTGRENIFLNGAILGMKRVEIKSRFDEIVAFAEMERFLDTPVKRYSSGMFVRLAFAVAAHLEPEILIVDEVLAVGDAEFQKKCLGKINEVSRREGRTVLFVSHNMSAIRELCSRALFIKSGTVAYEGQTFQTIQQYLSGAVAAHGIWRRDSGASPPSRKRAIIEQISVCNKDERASDRFGANESIFIRLDIRCFDRIPSTQVAVRVTNSEGVPIFTTTSSDNLESLEPLPQGRNSFRFRIPGAFLGPGRYFLIACVAMPRVESFDEVVDEVSFDIIEDLNHATRFHDDRKGVVTPLLEWDHVCDARGQ